MQNSLLTKLYDATNKGLDIILYYYPQARGCDGGRNKFFSIRSTDKTPSASLKLIKDVWRVTDFGDDGTALTPVEICMREHRIEFREALHTLAERYGVAFALNPEINKPGIEQRDATPEEPEGDFSFKLKESFSEDELQLLGPNVTAEICHKYSFYSVESFTTTSNRKTTTIKSTETYPIFMRDCGEFKKIMQPLNVDKNRRFLYKGTKPKDYINGLDELRKAYQINLKIAEEGEEKLPEAILCSGERDALNIAAMGYLPLWLNSESAKLPGKDYYEITKMVNRLYNLPDLDDTGTKKGTELALEYIDIYTIELPQWLRKHKDYRGNPRKDLRDFVEFKPNPFDFKELLRMAKPCKFWEKFVTKEGTRIEINTLYLLNFIRMNGFGKITDVESDKVTYIKMSDYKITEISGKQVRSFIINYLKTNNIDHDVQNTVLNSKRTGAGIMNDLDDFTPNFCDYTHDSQTMFFNNVAVNVYAHKIEEMRGKDLGIYTWENDITKHDFKKLPPAFSAAYNEKTKQVEFEINNISSHYFRYLINGSRMFWREEFENRISDDENENDLFNSTYKFAIESPRLTDEEIEEQRQHLINKIYTIGYLLHRYKSYSKALCVWIMENKITEEDESSGGSGKSFMVDFLKKLCNVCTMDGKNKKLTENQHFMDRVSEHTDILAIDDAYKYFDFGSFYSMITGSMIVNPKQLRSKEIQYKDSPKITITSNFPPRDNDSSTMRRLLMCVFSDYYHAQTDSNDYHETRTICDDFGYDLHDDRYAPEYWNEDINFCIDCLQFYLSMAKYNFALQPPMMNVNKRIDIQKIGEDFKEWADVFFAENGTNVNCLLDRKLVQDIFDPKKSLSSKRFKLKLITYCKNAEHIEELNPSNLKGYTDGRIIKNIDGETKEFIYVRTIGAKIDLKLRNIQTIQEKEEKEVVKSKMDLLVEGKTGCNWEPPKAKVEEPEVEVIDEFHFDTVWEQYGKKGNKKSCKRKWEKLPKKTKRIAIEHIPKYVDATPDITYRKNFETYLNQECWNDKIIEPQKPRSNVIDSMQSMANILNRRNNEQYSEVQT